MQCRVCMESKHHVLLDMGIVFTEDGKTLYDYFNECTQLEASANDNFPKTLCKTCAQELQIAYNFRTCALQSHEDFKKLLRSPKIEAESVHGATEEMYNFEGIEDNTDDPLGMDFNEAVRALKKSELELPLDYNDTDNYDHDLVEIQKRCVQNSPCNLAVAIKSENEELLPEVLSDVQPLNVMEIDSEKDDSAEESETEPIEKVGYSCEICTCTYSIKNELKKHIAKRHKSEIICVDCSKVFDMPNELRIHKKLVHDTDSPVKCDFCTDNPMMPRNELLKHFQTHHSCRYFKYFPRLRKRRPNYLGILTPYVCKYCSNTFSNAFDLEGHMKAHVFQCPFCSKNFNRISTYYTHAKRLHSCSESNSLPTPFIVEGVKREEEKLIECKACNKSYKNLGSYNTHMKEKHKRKSDLKSKNTESNAVVPEKESENTQSVESIIDPEHGEIQQSKEDSGQCSPRVVEANDYDEWEETTYNKLLCKELEGDKEPQELSKANRHRNSQRSHLKEKKRYLCSFCPRVLCTYLALELHERKQHLNIQSELKECPICQKKFSSDYLRKHIDLVHIAERNFSCDICGGLYKTKNQLYRHKQLHKKEREFPCTVCDKSFPVKNDLKIHMRVHTGELPFACHLCDRRFRIKVRLTYHLQHHANIKRKCKDCGKEFKNGNSLRNHSYEHAAVMPYTCPICNYGHAKREYFTKHMLRKHDTIMSADELFDMFKTNTGRNPYVKLVEEF